MIFTRVNSSFSHIKVILKYVVVGVNHVLNIDTTQYQRAAQVRLCCYWHFDWYCFDFVTNVKPPLTNCCKSFQPDVVISVDETIILKW